MGCSNSKSEEPPAAVAPDSAAAAALAIKPAVTTTHTIDHREAAPHADPTAAPAAAPTAAAAAPATVAAVPVGTPATAAEAEAGDVVAPLPAQQAPDGPPPSEVRVKRVTSFPSDAAVRRALNMDTEDVALAEAEQMANSAIIEGLRAAFDQLQVEVGVSEVEIAEIHQASKEKRKSVALALGIKEIKWDNDMLDQNPIAGLAKFLTSNRFRMIDLFKQLDKDNNHLLSFEHFKEGMVDLGIPISGDRDTRLRELFDEIDVDCDDQLSYLEFSSIRHHPDVKHRHAEAQGRLTPSPLPADRGSSRSPDGRLPKSPSGRSSKSPGDKRTKSQAALQHAARMAYITGVKAKKKVASKRRPSQDVGKHLSTHMDNARKANMTPTGQKRAHPFLDANGSNSQSPPKILLDQAGKTSIHVEDVEDITEV